MNYAVSSFPGGCRPSRAGLIWLMVLAVLFGLTSSCDSTRDPSQEQAGARSYVEIDHIRIPLFPNSTEQFNYTRSWFAEKEKKRAALQAFIQLYPDQREKCGLAALDLAYLQLGSDYRFAPPKFYFTALTSYQAIVAEYVDQPSIMAKALWYIGWISSDLLHDRKRGLEVYHKIVRQYPREPVSPLPPAPWVSLIYPREGDDGTVAAQTEGSSWAALALVEIIQQSEDGEAGWQAFTRLWQEYPDDIATGFGLKVVLQRRYQVDEALPIADQFMKSNWSNIHLLADIRKEIRAITSAEGAK